MTKRMLLTLCLTLLCSAASHAQRNSRPSPFMQEFGALVKRQERQDRARAAREHKPVFVPPVINDVDALNRALAAQGPPVPWSPSQERLKAVPLSDLLGNSGVKARTASLPPLPVPRAPVASASRSPKPVTRKVDAEKLTVRAGNPGAWYVDALRPGDSFKVKAVRGPWAFGDSHGDVKLKNVWVMKKGLAGPALPSTPGHTPYQRIRRDGTSRDYLEKKYASWASKLPDDGKPVQLAERAGFYDSYDPKTKQFSGREKTLDPATPRREVHLRWVTDDGKGAVVRWSGKDKNGKTIFSEWGYVPCAKLRDTKGRPLAESNGRHLCK